MEPLLAYLHYLAIILTAGFLVAELVLCGEGLGEAQVRRLPGLDLAFFASALVALGTGVLRVFFGGKGWMFYVPSPLFWAKVALFVAIGLLSIAPTLGFLRWRRAGGVPAPAEVAAVRRRIHLELGLLALMPLLAVLMARGFGR